MKKVLLFFVVFFLSVSTYAQVSVSGTVKDSSGETLPGVNVIAVGTSVGTSTDFDGNFEILAPEATQGIKFSFIGYADQTISMESAKAGNIQIVLQEDANVLEDVILIGYGTQKKSDITGAVSSVKSKDLEDQPVADAAVLLQGRAAGVQVTQTSGAPGSGISVKIRGTGSVGNSDPLYVVDGIFLNEIDHINSSDIASMEVLKDASATAIYGSRGANGVVLITTKKGNTEDVSVRIEAMAGIQNVWKSPDLMNSTDWLNSINTARVNGGIGDLVLMTPSDDPSRTTDWFEGATRSASIYKLNATVSRGNKKSNTLFSLGYVQNQGVVVGSDYSRLNLRLNTNYTISKMFKTGINLSVSNSATNGVSSSNINGVLINSQRIDPLTPITDPVTGEYVSTPYSDLVNPIAAAERDVRLNSSLLILANTYLSFEPFKGLVFKTSFSTNISRSKEKTYLPVYSYAGGDRNPTSSLLKGYSEFNGWLTENTINYNFMVGEDHSFELLGGFTAQRDQSEYLTASRNNIPLGPEELEYINASTDLESTNAWNSGTDLRMYSYLGRLNYNFVNKYFLTASIRRDGSSVFGPDMRFGNFPSASFGWKLRNEGFMDFLSSDVVNHIMFRTGWGRVGNANIPPYGYTATMQKGDSKVEYSYVFSGREYAGLAPVKMANTAMQWETVESTNIGLDLAFFESKITFSFDYFNKDTKDMLVRVPIPVYAGFDGSPYVNEGTVNNKGFEINFGYNGDIGTEFKYSVNFNISHIKNEVTYLGGGQPISGGSASFIGYTTRTEVGHPIGAFYGYKVDGVFQTQDEVDNSAQAGEGLGAGDFRFKDLNDDGIIDGDDRDYIGTPHPDFFYGINFNMSYKGFDAKIFFQGQNGNNLFNSFKYYNYATHKTYALTNDFSNHWTVENKSDEMFGLNTSTIEKNLRASDFYIEDGSYLRLKNLQIGYTFENPTEWMSNVRVYFSGQNIFTITKYSGLDPEVGGGSLNMGLDYGTYPQSRVFSLGANLSF